MGGSEVDRHHFLDFSITNILSPSCLLIYDQPLPHRTTALDPIQQQPGRQPRLIFLLGLDSTWADGNSIFTPMQPSNQPGTPNDEKVELTDSFEAIGTMMCTGLSQVQAPRTESKRKTDLGNVTENRALTYQIKWFNLIIHSSRQMERLPIVNERIGLAWNGEQALAGITERTEPQQERGEPAFFHTHAMTFAMNFSCQFPTLVPFSIELKRS